jgi:hypothetical protein
MFLSKLRLTESRFQLGNWGQELVINKINFLNCTVILKYCIGIFLFLLAYILNTSNVFCYIFAHEYYAL